MRALELICRPIACIPFVVAIAGLLVFGAIESACRAVAGFWRGVRMDWKSWKGTK